jgi:hypothetical protein
VTFALPLFATARKQGIELVSDFIATVDATLELKAQNETLSKREADPTEVSRVRPGPGCRAATASGAVPFDLSRQAKKLISRRLLRS